MSLEEQPALVPEPAAARPVSVGRNIIANYVGRAYSIGANYLFIPFYVGILGIEAYGLIAFYTLLLTITSLADIGLSATFSREAARQKDAAQLIRMLATAERILLLAVTSCAALIFVGAGWIAEHWLNSAGALGVEAMIWPLRLMALMLVPQLLITLYSAGLLGLQRQVAANIIQSLFVTVRAGLVILPILWRPDLTLFFGWQLAATLVFAIVARVVLVRAMGLGSFAGARFDWSSLRPHLAYAGGLLAITAISSINTQLDKALISRLFTIDEFGYYNIANALAQLPMAATMPIGVAFFPRLVASVASNDANLRPTYEEFVRLGAFVAAIGAFGLAMFAPEMLALWLQRDVPPVVSQVAATLAIGTLLLCVNIPPYYLCLAHGRSWLVVAPAAVTLIVGVPAYIMAIYDYGLWGGAMAWLLLNFVNLILLAFAISRLPAGAPTGSHLRGAVIPVLTALAPLLAARLLANGLDAPPLLACLMAGAGAAIAILAFGAIHRFVLQPRTTI